MKLYTLFLLLLCGAGCSRYIPVVKQTFRQVPICYVNSSSVLKKYLRSTKVYYEWDTIGFFDALWFSPEMRDVYSQQMLRRYNKNPEYNNGLEFYFLMLDEDEQPQLIMNCRGAPTWVIRLECDGVWYRPTCIERVELDPVMKDFFGFALTRYKNVYRVVFADLPPQVVPDDNATPLRMEISSLKYCVTLEWNELLEVIKERTC